jgi:hypothetical protein
MLMISNRIVPHHQPPVSGAVAGAIEQKLTNSVLDTARIDNR